MRAVVDIGSNSVKYLVGKVQRDAPVIFQSGSWVTRLGKNVHSTGLMEEDSLDQTDAALHDMVLALREAGVKPNDTKAVATSAVRDSKNSDVIVKMVKKILGCKLHIISGEVEARMSKQGAIAALSAIGENRESKVFVDVGGSSTEISLIENSKSPSYSFQAGALRCYEAFHLTPNAINDDTWLAMQKKLRDYYPLANLPAFNDKKLSGAVAVGGTLVMAARAMGAKAIQSEGNFSKQEIAYVASRDLLVQFANKIRRYTAMERSKMPGIDSKRADILPVGLLCLCTVLKILSCEQVFITPWGLRHGILIKWDDALT